MSDTDEAKRALKAYARNLAEYHDISTEALTTSLRNAADEIEIEDGYEPTITIQKNDTSSSYR